MELIIMTNTKQSTANEVTALRESNLEKDKRIAELGAQLDMLRSAKFSERNYHALTSRITDLENRLEALQSSQSQVSDELKNIRSVKVQGDFAVLVAFASCRSASAFARALQPSTPTDKKGGV
jgi:septation ring formation regulator EzrA